MTPLRLRRLLLVALAAALIVAQEVIGFEAAALTLPWSLSGTIFHAFAGLSYAVCAWIAWETADSPIPARIMITIAFLWLPPAFIAAMWPYGALWPLLESVGLFWAVLQAGLVVVYPTGRFFGPVEKWLLAIGGVAVVIRMLAVLFLMPAPARYPDCACAPNAYAFAANEALYSAIDLGFRALGIALIIGIIVLVTVRWMRGTTPARNIAFVMPVALILWCAAVTYGTVSDITGGSSALFTYLGYLGTASIPISFVAGLVFIRSLRGRVSDLMVHTRDGVDRDYWQAVLAETLRDPALKVYWWEPELDGYVDSRGTVMQGEPDRSRPRGRAIMPIDSQSGRLAVIDHDRALSENQELLDAVSTALTLSVDNGRLREELEQTLEEVRESRVRIIEAGIQARKKIERDLHDGSQQSLVSLALSLRMAITRASADGNDGLAADLEDALAQLSGSLKQLRELARGIHPSSLTLGGLGMAISELVARSPVPVQVQVDVPEHLPPLTETTLYFFIAECLTNVAKYAGASHCSIRLAADDDGLSVSVTDDGRGGADFSKGTGLMGLVDRIAALGGTVELSMGDGGRGTTVAARIPAAALVEQRVS
ncbi:hypothetical protein ASF62_08060 [Leifsonia sp. Leaf325]|nr:histidine kinase [Leifsonia sp. Leaf325]KQQ94095.1 hypothetical protein ASF62_08060 [Leifsonia sp. Leaf325]